MHPELLSAIIASSVSLVVSTAVAAWAYAIYQGVLSRLSSPPPPSPHVTPVPAMVVTPPAKRSKSHVRPDAAADAINGQPTNGNR